MGRLGAEQGPGGVHQHLAHRRHVEGGADLHGGVMQRLAALPLLGPVEGDGVGRLHQQGRGHGQGEGGRRDLDSEGGYPAERHRSGDGQQAG